MRKEHLNLLKLTTGCHMGVGSGDIARQIAGALMDVLGYLPCWRVRCTTLPQVAARAVLLAGAIADEAVLADIAAGLREVRLRGRRRLPAGQT